MFRFFSNKKRIEKLEENTEKFNEYFSRIGQTKYKQTKNYTDSYQVNETEFSKFLKHINFHKVKKVIDKLKPHKSASLDGIPAEVIKKC